MKLKFACSLEESYDWPRQHIKKQRHYFADKGPSRQSLVFPVVTYGCESWTIKKVDRWRTDAFELQCWTRLLRVPWTARRSNQSILKEISPEYSLEGLMLKLKLQSFGYLMQRTDSLEKTLMLGKIEGGRKRGWQRMTEDEMPPTRWAWVWVSSGVGDGQGSLVCCDSWGCKELDTTEWLKWTELKITVDGTAATKLKDPCPLEEKLWST